MVDRPPRRQAAAALLSETFGPRFRDPRYLRWLYDDNPDGPAVVGEVHEGADGIAHYACVPQHWRNATTRLLLGITLNAAVRADARRRGIFTGLARDVYRRAADAGMRGTITVANRNSTPPFVGKLGLEMVRPLPVVLRPRTFVPAGVVSWTVDERLPDDTLRDLAADAAAVAPRGWVRDWTPASLAWRLAAPTARYSLHRSPSGWAVATAARQAGVRFAVVLKLVPRTGRDRIVCDSLASAACRHHRAPAAVYAGFNAHARVAGVALPRRALPSPLNLLVRSFDALVSTRSLHVIDTYEFLDADHY